jgi:hypothetical protein
MVVEIRRKKNKQIEVGYRGVVFHGLFATRDEYIETVCVYGRQILFNLLFIYR